MKVLKSKNLLKKASTFLSASTLVILAGISTSSAITPIPLDLVDVPLFLQGSAPPAIALSFDTSPKTKTTSIFYVDGLDPENLPNGKKYIAAPLVNKLYYNPNIEYKPPLHSDGSSFPNSNFTDAWIDGFIDNDNDGIPDDNRTANKTNKQNLSTQYKVINQYTQSNGMTCYDDGSGNCNGNANGQRAYYYKYTGTFPVSYDSVNDDTNFSKVSIPFDHDDEQNFANWYSYYKTRNMLIKTSATRAFGVLDDGFKLAWQSFKQNAAFEVPMMPLRGAHREAFWSWLLNLKTTGNDALMGAMEEAGTLFEQQQPYLDDGVGPDELSCQQNFHVLLTNSYANGGGNVTATSYDDSNVTFPDGNVYKGSASYADLGEAAIYKEDSAQDSFADLAFHFWSRDLRPNLDNKVPKYYSSPKNSAGVDQFIGVGQDVWDTSTEAGNAIYWNPQNDPANWQHMVNFVIGLGVSGNLSFSEDFNYNQGDYEALRTYTPNEPQITYKPNGNPNPPIYTTGWSDLGGNDGDEEIDDMWHGALNSRGEFISVKDPNELTDAFLKLIEHLYTRRTGSSAESTVSANIVTEETKVYKTGFDATDWSGTVVAQKINLDGSIGDPIWDAACKLTSSDTLTPQPCGSLAGADETPTKTYKTRKIFTYDKSSKSTYEFRYSTLSSNLKQILELSPLVQNGSATLEDLVNYLRGDATNELRNGGAFRNRRVILGDVIHSAAKVVRGPSESYIDDAFPADSNIKQDGNLYTDFKVDHKNRRNVILVGANDGMLHAFDANTGDELWAYIPSMAYKNLFLLADPVYVHQNYVDQAPVIRDVYTNGSWRTVAVGGMRLGGQGYYALDITNPESPEVLWEYTDADDSDMGYSYAEPFITRLANDKWVAFLSNGYNNVIPDLHIGSGTSVLYMVDMESGNLLKKFDTGEGSLIRTNGMAAAVASDIPYDITADTLFVGDLRGDVYRMDLTDPSNIVFEKMISSVNPYATPITTALRLTQFNNFSNNTDDILVHIGTGKFIENIDLTLIGTDYQYVAGIFDQGTGSTNYPIDLANDNRIVDQTATDDNVAGTRLVTNNAVSKASNLGWRLKLPNLGERVIAKMATRASAHFLIIASYLPKGGNKCATGGASWVMVLDNRTGGQPLSGSILRDGTVDGIYIENQVFGVTPIGFAGGGGEILIIGTDTGVNDGEDTSIVIPDFTWRRRSWHRMFQDGEI